MRKSNVKYEFLCPCKLKEIKEVPKIFNGTLILFNEECKNWDNINNIYIEEE